MKLLFDSFPLANVVQKIGGRNYGKISNPDVLKKFFDLQKFANNPVTDMRSAEVTALKMLANFFNDFKLRAIADYLSKYDSPFDKLAKDFGAVYSLVGALYKAKKNKDLKGSDYASIIVTVTDIVSSTLTMVQHIYENKPDATVAGEATAIVGKFSDYADKVANLVLEDSPLFFPIMTAAAGLAANIVVGVDGFDDDEKAKLKAQINSYMVKIVAAMGTSYAKKYFPGNKALTGSLGPLALATGAFSGLLTGLDKYQTIVKKYTDNGIPSEIAVKDAIIEAVANVIHETGTSYTNGVDDVVFGLLQSFASVLTGIKVNTDKNYAEWIGEIFKTLNVKNSGTAKGETLIAAENDKEIYGDDGDDYIGVMASNVTIWGGNDKDTIVSLSDASNNSLFGGVGEDFIVSYGKRNSLYGGKNKDRIAVYGISNVAYGEGSDDIILVGQSATGTTVNGGTGKDVIAFEGTKNAVIQYNSGDGNDTIVGYDENYNILLDSSYSTAAGSNNDVVIKVGSGSINLVEAKGKTLKINGKKISTANNDTVKAANPQGRIKSPTLTGFWNGTPTVITPTVSGVLKLADGGDSVENRGDSGKKIMTIIGGNGNDTIKNFSCTNRYINGASGNDFISNDISNDCSFVTIIGGDGNDTIKYDNIGSEALVKNVLIFGDDGDDSIVCNYTSYSTIYGGYGNDYTHFYGRDSTVQGGDGSDTIECEGYSARVDGGNGNDYIRAHISYTNAPTKNTLTGGAGKDIFAFMSSFGSYVDEDYMDCATITDYTPGQDKIKFEPKNTRVFGGIRNNALISSIVVEESDVLIYTTVPVSEGEPIHGKIRLQNAKGKPITIIDSDGKETTKVYDGVTKKGVTVSGTTMNLDKDFDGNMWLSKNSEYNKVKIINAKTVSDDKILAGNSKSNSILGGSGKNSLWGGKGGNNTLTGGSSSDQYWFSGGGNDVVTNFKSGTSSDADVLVFYNTGFKKMTRSGKNIIVTGATGKKITLKSDSGSDTVFLYSKDGKNISGAKVGESSDKSLTYDSAVKYYKLNGNGTLKVTGSDNNKVSLTGAGVTYSGITRIDASGATGDNILVGSSKLANSIVGGSGKDSLTGDNSTDYLAGGVGDDSISGGKGKDTLYGQAGNDTVRGGTGKDYVSGAAGDDYLYGDDGNDTVRGGSDNDHVYGGNGDDMVYGDKGKDYLSGGAGNDYLSGGAEVDTLVGGADNDTLRAGEGNDYLSGGTGDDRLYGEDGEDTLTGGDGNDYVSGGTGNDSLIGGTGKDSLHSGTGDDIVSGGDGNDKLYGDAGNDILEGEAGKDYLSGGKGDDSLYGGAGNDTVYGGEGNDYLSGGDGKDTFWFNVGGGSDTVTDYVAGNDKIQIKSGVVKSGYTEGSDVVFVLSDKKNGKDNGQIIIKDGKDKNISVVGVSGKKYTYINGTRSYTSARIDSSNDVNKSWFMTGDDNYNVSGNYNLESPTKNSVGNLNISTGQTTNVSEIIFAGSTKNIADNSQSGLNKA